MKAFKLVWRWWPTYLFRHFGWPGILPFSYTLMISTRCNSRCRTCNIWKQRHDELLLEEWAKVIDSLGTSPYFVTISGGEPFLQPHLGELCRLLIKKCRPGVLAIPTNSLLWPRIDSTVAEILTFSGRTKLVINLSLDGVGEKHDLVRGIKGSFLAFEKNYQRLQELKKKFPQLTLGIHSVLSRFNQSWAEELIDYALAREPDQYILEIAEQRAELGTMNKKVAPTPVQFTRVMAHLDQCLKATSLHGLARVSGSFRREYYRLLLDWVRGEKIDLCDYAGWASCEITSWGEVWPSCMGGLSFGNLRQANYHFRKLWFGPEARSFRRQYQCRPESFPLANAAYTNMLFNIPTLIKVAGRWCLAS